MLFSLNFQSFIQPVLIKYLVTSTYYALSEVLRTLRWAKKTQVPGSWTLGSAEQADMNQMIYFQTLSAVDKVQKAMHASNTILGGWRRLPQRSETLEIDAHWNNRESTEKCEEQN